MRFAFIVWIGEYCESIVSLFVCCIFRPFMISSFLHCVIRSQLVSQLIHVQLVSLDCGPQGVINKIYNLLHHVLG